MKELLNYDFEFVDNISPILDSYGHIKEFYPQDRYAKKDTTALNKHGDGAFCRFSIHPKWSRVSGVYAFFIDNELVYLGQCLDFAKRFNLGYGNIAPKNCYKGGQSTNCKINKVVLNAVKSGKKVSLYFHINPNYDAVERELIVHFKPKYNVSLTSALLQPQANKKYVVRTGYRKSKSATNTPTIGSTESIRQYIIQNLKKAKEAGVAECVLISGNIHRDMGLHNRMPSVCSAMYQVMKSGDDIISTTPSGKSSTIKIKYNLNT